MKTFTTLDEMMGWCETQLMDRYSPYEIISVNRDTLTVQYIRID